MGKYRAPRREQNAEQRIREELKNLKKLVKHLRKELDKARNNPFRQIKDNIEEDDPPPKPKKEEKQWKCFECPDGYLHLIIYETRAGVKYFRKCDRCLHRTKGQFYNKDVKND